MLMRWLLAPVFVLAILAPAGAASPPARPGNLQVVANVGAIGERDQAEFSPDGKILATWNRTHIKLWGLERGGSLLRVMTYWAFIHDLAWSPDSRTLATAHKDGSLKIWDASTGLSTWSAKVAPVGDDGPEVWMEGLSFSPDGRLLAAVSQHSNGDVARVWNLAEKRQLTSLPFNNDTTDRSLWGDNAATRFAAGGSKLIASTSDRLRIIDVDGFEVRRTFTLPKLAPSQPAQGLNARSGTWFGLHSLIADDFAVAFDHGKGCEIASLVVLDLKSNSITEVSPRPACNYPQDNATFGDLHVGVDPAGKRLVYWREGLPGVQVWSLDERRRLGELAPLGTQTGALRALSGDFAHAATFADDAIAVSDAGTGAAIARLVAHGEDAYQVLVANGGGHVLLAGPPEDGEHRRLSQWSADRVGPRRLEAPPKGTNLLHMTRAGDAVLASRDDNTLRFLSLPTMREVRNIAIDPGRAITTALLSPDETTILVAHTKAVAPGQKDEASMDEVRVSLIDAASGRRLFDMGRPSTESIGVSGMAFSADGQLLAIGFWSGEIAIIDARTRRRIRVVAGKEPMDSAVFAIVFTPDNKHVVGCTRDAGAALWRIADGRLVRTFETQQVSGHVNCSALAISGDGELLAAGLAERARSSGDVGAERSIVLWPVDGRSGMRKLEGHEGGVGWVTFSAGDRIIVSASYDGTIRHWDRKTGKQLALSSLDRSRDWAMLTSDGFIASSSNRSDVLGIVNGLAHTALQEVHHALFAPDLVREVVAGDTRGEVAAAAQAMNLDKVLASGPAPAVAIEVPGGTGESRSDLVTVRGRVVDKGKGIGRVEWRVNGITTAVVSRAEGAELALTQELALDPGDNVIELVAYNASNLLASRPARTSMRHVGAREGARPRMHVLAIGVDDYDDPGYTMPDGQTTAYGKLNLAVKDATALADAITRAGKGLYADIRVRLLSNEKATAEGIDTAVSAMAKEVHPRDTFVLFAAAHGTSERGHFYMIPYGFRSAPGSLAATAVGQERIQDWVANRIKAKRVLILLDTCESGALVGGHTRSRIDEPASEAAIGRLHEATGRPVLTAAARGQFAHEGILTEAGDRHGVFTWSLLEALRKGDSNANGLVELSELVAHVQVLVPQLAARFGGDGRAGVAAASPVLGEQTARFGSRGEDFVLARKLD